MKIPADEFSPQIFIVRLSPVIPKWKWCDRYLSNNNWIEFEIPLMAVACRLVNLRKQKLTKECIEFTTAFAFDVHGSQYGCSSIPSSFSVSEHLINVSASFLFDLKVFVFSFGSTWHTSNRHQQFQRILRCKVFFWQWNASVSTTTTGEKNTWIRSDICPPPTSSVVLHKNEQDEHWMRRLNISRELKHKEWLVDEKK